MTTPNLDFGPALPELILAGVAMVVLLTAAALPHVRRDTLAALSVLGVLAAIGADIWLWNWDGPTEVLGKMVAADHFAVVARMIVLVVALAGIVLGWAYFDGSRDDRGELYPLILFAAAGMTLITAAADLIVVFLALEILSLSLYILTGFSRRRTSGEASMKYFVLGAFSSAFFLYGIALTYGSTGTTNINAIANAASGAVDPNPLMLFAGALLLIGFSFKIAAVPFHMWTPDVYQGAPTSVTGFMSAGTKVAAFAALIRLLAVAYSPLAWDWRPIIWTLAILSMILGAFVALVQTDVKRMLAYSSISQAGYVLIALGAPGADAIQAALFYLIAYSLMTVGAFGVVMLVTGRERENSSLESFRGLARTSPLLGGLLTVFLVSLTGVPPTVGFLAKIGVFAAGIGAGGWAVVLVAVLSSVVAAFFYLRVVVLMYMEEPAGAPIRPDRAPAVTFVTVLAAAGVLLLGVAPGLISGFLHSASVLSW